VSVKRAARPEPFVRRRRILTVHHVTTYIYSAAVRLGEHRMMFRPRESHDLRVVKTRLAIKPHPADLRWLHDVFDNSVAIATFTGTTRELQFDSTVTLEHFEEAPPDYTLEADAQIYPFQYPLDERSSLAAAVACRYPDPEVNRWARRFLPPSGSTRTMTLLLAMTGGIREQFVYLRRSEKGVQSPAETIALGSGSCRDFALLMMEAVRSLGLAARFVSGYIYMPGTTGTLSVSSGSTHAWMQVYLPGAGWVDFDPTNSIIGNRNLIRVAFAWDPSHALPLWGSFIGKASSFLSMDVAVSVTEKGATLKPDRRQARGESPFSRD
jgi:transglutaminase-like putative cysteine protease